MESENLLSPIAGFHYRGERLGVVEWAERHVDFSRSQTYDSPRKIRYSIEDMPYMREPMEAQFDPNVREIVFLKCSRAGATENLVFIPMRYRIARDPENQIYIGPQEEKTQEIHRERIIKGMALADETAEKYAKAVTDIEGFIGFEDSTLTSTHNQDRSLAKGSGWPCIYADEVSQYRGFKVSMIRERASYRWSHIFWGSSPDPEQTRPSDEDPIFLLFDESDKRYWMMPDKDGGLFRFQLGGKDSDHGLRWAEDAKRVDGTWDLNRVAQTAHYKTPCGYQIYNHERIDFVKRGKWVATENPHARPFVRGYHLNRFYVPFAWGDFGSIAVKWLSAVRQGQMEIRNFRYEIEAEKFSGEIQVVKDDLITQTQGAYKRGEGFADAEAYRGIYIGKQKHTVVTVDVQQQGRKNGDELYYIARQFVAGGDSGLVDRGFTREWETIKEFAAKNRAAKIVCDNSYSERQREVFEQAARGVMRGMIPCFGRDNIKEMYKVTMRDIYEGTAQQGMYPQIHTITWNPNQVKDLLFRLICGTDAHKWRTYEGIDELYKRHMTSEENKDGQWTPKHKDNHWFDCEAMSLMIAIVLGLYTFIPAQGLTLPQEQTKQEKKPEPLKANTTNNWLNAGDFRL